MRILIGTPAYGESVTTTYCETMFWLFDHFGEKHPKIKLDHKFCAASLITYTRNYFASLVLADKRYTHLLLIDSDMGFNPSLIEQMTKADKPIVGAICPRRAIDLNKLFSLLHRIDNPQLAQLVAQDYVGAGDSIYYGGDGSACAANLVAEGSMIRVRNAGTGVMLIRREVLERIKATFPELWVEKLAGSAYAAMGLQDGVLQCFDQMTDHRGIYVGEDLAFCRRWVEGCNGEIWSVITETIVHKGTFSFVGNYFAKLQHSAA
jgi:hypothetical protein